MMMEPLSSSLLPFAEAIAATERAIVGAEVQTYAPVVATGSQLGGLPWWPAGRTYPIGRDGAPLFLLAQINLGNAAPLDPFPASGLLQVFIGASELYGLNLDDLTAPFGFLCVHHPDLSEPRRTDFAELTAADCSMLPLHEPLRARTLRLENATMVIDPADYRFDSALPEIAADEALSEAYFEFAQAPAIRLGGYPSFTQTDPRAYQGHRAYGDVTLLTVDTTDGIMWGDTGVAQFFMHERDLRRRDFSKVVYNWDCC